QVPPGTATCTVPGGHGCTPFTVPVPDPYAGLTPPTVTPADCSGSDTFASHIGSDGNLQHGVYKSSVSLSSSISFEAGTYIFCNGLSVSGGSGVKVNNLCDPTHPTVPCPVLFYLQGGSLNVSGQASLAVSAPTSGSYAGLLIWQRASNATPMSIAGQGAITLLGAIYAPSAVVSVSGLGKTPVITSIVAQAISIAGNGGSDIGILPAETVTSVSPNTAEQGQTLSVTINGTNFVEGQYLNATFACAGVTILPGSLTRTSSTTLTANVTVTNSATLGPCNVTVTNGDQTTATGNGVFTVTPAATKLVLSAATTTPAAGAANNLTITAQDAGGNTVASYTGDKTLTFSGALPIGTNTPTVTNKAGTPVTFGTATTITFTNGVATVSGTSNGVMKLYKAGISSIVVSDGSINNNPGLSVTVSAGGPSALTFTNCSANGGAAGACGGAGVAVGNNGFMDGFVSVMDAFGNVPTVTAGSTWTVTITSSSGSFVVTNSPVAITGPAVQSSTRFHVKLTGNNGSATLTAHATSGSPAVSDGTMTVKK
ncbi:MAG: Mucin-22, partial [Actinomycetia bacterium]|nr:Mucin-22 [Actinomycetes bacterium]